MMSGSNATFMDLTSPAATSSGHFFAEADMRTSDDIPMAARERDSMDNLHFLADDNISFTSASLQLADYGDGDDMEMSSQYNSNNTSFPGTPQQQDPSTLGFLPFPKFTGPDNDNNHRTNTLRSPKIEEFFGDEAIAPTPLQRRPSVNTATVSQYRGGFSFGRDRTITTGQFQSNNGNMHVSNGATFPHTQLHPEMMNVDDIFVNQFDVCQSDAVASLAPLFTSAPSANSIYDNDSAIGDSTMMDCTTDNDDASYFDDESQSEYSASTTDPWSQFPIRASDSNLNNRTLPDVSFAAPARNDTSASTSFSTRSSTKQTRSTKSSQCSNFEEDHTCNICGMKLSSRFSLKRHAKRHTGERPFKCNECGKRFGEKSTLKRHVKAKHVHANLDDYS